MHIKKTVFIMHTNLWVRESMFIFLCKLKQLQADVELERMNLNLKNYVTENKLSKLVLHYPAQYIQRLFLLTLKISSIRLPLPGPSSTS